LWKAVLAHGDHEVDDANPPWRMSWGPAAIAAQALVVFVTFDAVGALEAPDRKLTRIRDLSLDTIVERVLRATDVERGRACDSLIQEELDESPRREQRIGSVRDYIGLAAVSTVAGPELLQIDQPLVEAFVRMHHHPAAPATLADFALPGKAPGGPRFAELANQHPELTWDKQAVKALVWRAIQANGDHELDDATAPWLMHWGPSSAAAFALIVFVTYDALGSL
jgi:hypothetical protein